MISRLPAYWTVPVLMPPFAGGFAFSWAVFISVIVALVLFSCTCTFQVHVTERAMQPSIIAPVGPVGGGFLSIAGSETYLVQSVNFGVVRSC